MSCTACLALKLWQSCDVIKAPSVHPVFIYFSWSAKPYSLVEGYKPRPISKAAMATNTDTTKIYWRQIIGLANKIIQLINTRIWILHKGTLELTLNIELRWQSCRCIPCVESHTSR